MMKRAGFTVVEIMVALCIIIVISSISYSVFAGARKRANRTNCMSHLRQLGLAVSLYRDEVGGSSYGRPSAMGLPSSEGLRKVVPFSLFECKGEDPSTAGGYTYNYPDPTYPEAAQDQWARYSQHVGESAIILFDTNHQSSYPRSQQWENWTVMGVRLDTSVTTRTHLGFPLTDRWWHDE